MTLKRDGVLILVVCLVVGAVCGAASGLFTAALDFATQFRLSLSSPWSAFLMLCIVAAAIYKLERAFPDTLSGGSSRVFTQVQKLSQTLPLAMAPFVFVFTSLSHLAGASVGREGAAVQIGASLSDQLSRSFDVAHKYRRTVLVVAIASAFGSVTHAPLAGVVFGIETTVGLRGRSHLDLWIPCALGVLAATLSANQIPHSHVPYHSTALLDLSAQTAIAIIGVGLGVGSVTRVFLFATQWLQKSLPKAIAVILLIAVLYFGGAKEYSGLGLPQIQSALIHPVQPNTWLIKLSATLLSLSAGFKGGEFIPLIFIGTTLGSTIGSSLLGPMLSHDLSAETSLLGFSAAFAAASKTPWSCSFLAAEYFGWHSFVFVLAANLISRFVSGSKTIYAKNELLTI